MGLGLEFEGVVPLDFLIVDRKFIVEFRSSREVGDDDGCDVVGCGGSGV